MAHDQIPDGVYVRWPILRIKDGALRSLGNKFVAVERQPSGVYLPVAAGGETITADLSAIESDTSKIDESAVNGLAGTENSLAYRVHEVEHHLHSYERFLETAAVPSGETHVADEVGDGGGAFQVDAGSNAWGEWVQVIGSDDTPVQAGNVSFDFHRLEIEATERNATYFVQIAFGASGAAALAAGDYTVVVFTPQSNLADSGPVTVQAERQDSGTKVWVRCKCPGQDTGTFDFYPGLHEYPG